jgi:hypothetical protein
VEVTVYFVTAQSGVIGRVLQQPSDVEPPGRPLKQNEISRAVWHRFLRLSESAR